MRRDKAATRILLILSVVHGAAAAPAITEKPKDVRPGFEKRANSGDLSHLVSRMDNNLPPTSGTLPSQDDTSPAPGDPGLHSDPPAELGTPQLHDDMSPMPGAPPSQHDPLSASGMPQLHNGQPSTPGTPLFPSSASEDPQIHDDLPPWWPHTNWRPPEPALHEDSSWLPPYWHPHIGTLYEPSTSSSSTTPGTPESQNDSPSEAGTPESQNDPPSEAGTSELDDPEMDYLNRWPEDFDLQVVDGYVSSSDFESEASTSVDSPPALGAPQVHDGSGVMDGASSSSDIDPDTPMPVDSPPASGTPFDSWHRGQDHFRPIWVATPSLDFDSEPPPLHSETPPSLHAETPPVLDSETAPTLEAETPQSLHPETPPVLGSETAPTLEAATPQSLHSETPPVLHSETAPTLEAETPLLESEALPSAPETGTFFNDALKEKLKVVAGVGAVAVVLAGGALGVDKLIKGHSHGSQPAGRDLANSGIVGRDTSMHPRPLKAPVSRARANLRNEDLRLLSILTRRALERLD